MSEERLTPFEDYVRKVTGRLGGLSAEQRDAVAAELRAHLSDAAQEAGRDPADAALQRELIGRLGPARRLGRELALARMSPAQRRARPWLFVGAIGLLLAPLLIALAFVMQEEEASEFILILSQSPMIFAVPAISALCWPYAPRLSGLALIIGLLGNSLFPAVALIDFLAPGLPATWEPPALLAITWVLLPGVWQLLAAVLVGLRLRGLSPAEREHDALIGPALLGAATGLAWFAFYGGMAGPVPALMGLVPFAWLILNFLWGIALAIGLLLTLRPGIRIPQIPDGPQPTR